MKKLICSLSFLFFISIASYSQSFMHGAGFSIFVASAPGGNTTPNGGLMYSPRFNFIEGEDMSVSVGIPLSAGFSINYNSRDYYGESSNSSSAMLDIPLMVNLNMGAGSTKEAESRFGYFVGAGFGYHYGTINYSDYYGDEVSSNINSYGPAGNAGIRFGVGNSGKTIEVRFSYMKGLDNSKANIFGGGALFNF